jgi:glycosyltransferase involved in cell wall biosynthesis
MSLTILAITSESDRPESALLCGLAERGHKIKLIGKLHPDFSNLSIKEEPLAIKSRFDFAASRFLKSEIEAFRPDIVHAFSGRGLAAAVRAKGNFKLIGYRGTVGHLSHFDPASICSYLSHRVDAISCVSQAVKDYLIGMRVPAGKLFVIHKGHQASWYSSSLSQALTRESLNIPSQNLIVICVANARPVKGIDVFIAAANLLADESEISFLVVGEIRKRNLLTLSKNPNLKFLGFRSDAQALIGLSDLLVVPSRSREGLPKALLEAMALKKAIIASRVGGIPEAIEHDLEGLLIPPCDPSILSKAIKYLKARPELAQMFAQNAFAKLETELTVANMLDATEAMYSSTLINF